MRNVVFGLMLVICCFVSCSKQQMAQHVQCSYPKEVSASAWDTTGDGYLYFSDRYGWFQKTHFNAHYVIEKVTRVVKAGGGTVIMDDKDVTGCFLETSYQISSAVSEDQIPGVAFSIFMDYQWRWEMQQAVCPSTFSSYSIEDLPSNTLAFIGELQDVPISVLLEELDAYRANRTSSLMPMSVSSLEYYCGLEGVPLERPMYTTSQLPVDGVGRMVDLLPKRLNLESCEYEIVDWPWNLPEPIHAIDEEYAWCRVSQRESDGYGEVMSFEFDDCLLTK